MPFPYHGLIETLQAVHNCQWFMSFNLVQGYLQMPVEEADIKKLHLGLDSSGLIWVHSYAIQVVQLWVQFLSPHGDVPRRSTICDTYLYLDDICVFAASIDEMLDCIELVFKWLEEFNLKIKPKKCHFFQCSVVFLGYVLSADGISANPEKVDKVKNWPVPTKPKGNYNHFLGLASYYHQFIPKFTAIAKCLHQLVGPSKQSKKLKSKKNEHMASQNKEIFMWTGEYQEAFDLLKSHLTSAPVLGYPDLGWPFKLETDASLQGLGTILSQRDENGTSCVIAYASQSLWPSEQSMQNYSCSKIRTISTEVSSDRKTESYLLGSKFTVYTDNNPHPYVQGK